MVRRLVRKARACRRPSRRGPTQCPGRALSQRPVPAMSCRSEIGRSLMKPHVTVHMMTSVDGRIRTNRWTPFEGRGAYEEIHALLEGDAWMCGRITMSGYAMGRAYPETADRLPRTDHIAPARRAVLRGGARCVGKLCWGRAGIDDDHLVVVLTEAVSDRHLAGLRRDGRLLRLRRARRDRSRPRARDAATANFGNPAARRGGRRPHQRVVPRGRAHRRDLVARRPRRSDGRVGGPALFDIDGHCGCASGRGSSR